MMNQTFESAINSILATVDPEYVQKVKEHYTWICDHVLGNDVLDVGSYNGILAVLLAKVGKKVKLIISEDEVEPIFLSGLDDDYRRKIEVVRIHDISENGSNNIGHYDTVVYSERDGKGFDLLRWLVEARTLGPNGRLIISYPFGIFGENKQSTYVSYGFEKMKILSYGYVIQDFDILGGTIKSMPHYWMCLSLDNREGLFLEPDLLNSDYLNKIEQMIQKKEQMGLQTISEMRKQALLAERTDQEKTLFVVENLKRIMSSVSQHSFLPSGTDYSEHMERIISTELEGSDLDPSEPDNGVATPKGDIEAVLKENEQLRSRFDVVNMKLVNSLDLISNELREEERLINNYNELKIKYENLERKHNNIVNSRSVRLVLRFWNVLKGRPRH